MIYKQYGAAGMPRFASHDVLATASRRALGGLRECVRSLPQNGLCPIEE